MRIKKIYFNRIYDQWRGEPLYVEDGLDDDKLYIRIMDVENYKRGAVNTITVDYKDLNGATYTILGECDYDKRLAIFDIPLSILSNNGIYEVGFSMTFNTKDKEGVMLKTAIQTFEIIDAIEADDEAIAQDPHYPILVDLINQLADYKVDTSIFPTREEMNQAIEDNLNTISMDEILKQINEKGYITLEQLNKILRNYLTKADGSGFAKQSDLNKYVTNIKYLQDLERYALKSSLDNFVLKESGKGLSTNDLTDELYDKLVNLDLNDIKIDLTGYATETFVINKILEAQLGDKDIDLTGYAKIEDLPKNVSDLINDLGFLTSIPSEYVTEDKLPKKLSELENDEGYIKESQLLEEYAKKTELHEHSNKDLLDNITQEKINAWDTGANIDLSRYAEKNELHEHSNKNILDNITQEDINSWNTKADGGVTINDNINETSTTQTYSNQMIESRLLELSTDTTAVADDLDSMDERVLYLEETAFINQDTIKKNRMDIDKILEAVDTPPTFTRPTLDLRLNKTIIEHNTATSITITPIFNQNDGGVLTNYTLVRGAKSLVNSSTIQSYTDNITVSHRNSVTYTATAYYSNGESKTSTFGVVYDGLSAGNISANNTVRAYANSYYGVIDGDSITDVTALTSVLGTGRGRTITYNMTKQRSVYMYPQSFGALTSIKDSNNFEYINSYTRSEMVYNEVEYYVYILTDPVTITGFKQIFN